MCNLSVKFLYKQRRNKMDELNQRTKNNVLAVMKEFKQDEDSRQITVEHFVSELTSSNKTATRVLEEIC